MVVEGVLAVCAAVTINVEPVVPTMMYGMTVKQLSDTIGKDRPDNWLLGVVTAVPTVTYNDCTATMRYRDVRLYVGSDLTKSQCAWTHIFRHEMQHIEVYNTELAKINGHRITSGDHKTIDDIIRTYFRMIFMTQRHVDENIDEINSNACGGVIPRILRNIK